MWGALSDERTGLSFAGVTVNSNKSLVSMYNLHFTSLGIGLTYIDAARTAHYRKHNLSTVV
jgi:hypothetical protein